MAQPEFADYWSEVLVNDLRIAREEPVFQSPSQQVACFTGKNPGAANSDMLAGQIETNTPQTAFNGGAVSMGDVVRSSVIADNLFPLYRAHLFSLTNQPNSGMNETQQREIFGTQFDEVYLNRQLGCLACHNSAGSLTDAGSGWNRHFPVTGLFEKALWGANSGIGTDRAHAMYRSQSGGLQPWGVSSCGSFATQLGNDTVDAYFTQNQGKQFGLLGLQGIMKTGYDELAQHGLQRTLAPAVQQQCDFCANNCQGNNVSWQSMTNNAVNAAAVKTLVTTTCTTAGCHGTAAGTGAAGMGFPNTADWAIDLQSRVVPGNANGSLLFQRVGIQKNMPPGAPLAQVKINQIRDWINSMPAGNQCAGCGAVNCNAPKNFVKGAQAFSYLVAARISNNIWNEIEGSPLTIANYFPRNQGQRDILWNLTESAFIPHHWSLHSTIERIVTSNYFNRKPPRSTALPSSYVLPPIGDPWTVADPRISPVSDPGYDPNAHPDNHNNAMSESVHRYSAWSLVNSVHKALDWPQPQRFPGAGVNYPSQNLLRSIGFHFSDVQPGNRLVDFQGLLAWETVHGRCQKPAGVGTDWINRLITEINNFNAANPDAPLSVADVAMVIRDWLLGYGSIGAIPPVGLAGAEVDALKTHFSVAALSDPVSGVADLETKLRDLCGMQLESPYFQLAGIAEQDLGPQPRLRVCNANDCSYKQMCQALAPAIAAEVGPNTVVFCGDNSVSVQTINLPRPPILVNLCPAGLCGVLDKFVNKGCPIMAFGEGPIASAPGRIGLRATTADFDGRPPVARDFCPQQPPMCDPRCGAIDCCGGPGPNPAGRTIQSGDMMVAWADGARILTADNARILPAGQNQFVPLEKGRELRVGDLIALRGGSGVEIQTRDNKTLRTPKGGMPKTTDDTVALMMITGGDVLKRRSAPFSKEDIAAAREEITRAAKAQPARGEAGPGLTTQQLMSYKYPREELELGRRKPSKPERAQPGAKTVPGVK